MPVFVYFHRSTISIINQIKSIKNILFTLHKIKLHLNPIHNQADLLAKNGTNKPILKITYNFLNLPIHFLWNNCLIPFKIRTFIKNIYTIQELYSWSTLKIFKNIAEPNWTLCFDILNTLEHNHSKYSFRIKMLTNNLPTMENLYICYPYLYPTSKCSRCSDNEDTTYTSLFKK